MSIYSKQFAVGVLSTAGPELVFTVPTGYIAVLRGFDAFLYTGAVFICLLSVNGNPSCLGAVAPIAQPNAGFGSWSGYQVFNPGDALYLAGNNPGISYILSGYLLALP
jgi:hypothetical protein